MTTINEIFRDKGLLLAKEALDFLEEKGLEFAKDIVGKVSGPIVTLDEINSCLKTQEKKDPEVEVVYTKFKPIAKEYASRVKMFKDTDVTGKSESEGKVGDFVDNFRDKFRRLARILKERGGNLIKDIDTLKMRKYTDTVRLIVMVTTINTTKNGHRFMVAEDETSSLNVLIHRNNDALLNFSQSILSDEVIAVEGVLKQDLFIANQIIRPDIPMRKTRRTEEDIAVAMLSDIHVGSRYFLQNNFERFLDWLNGKVGNEKQRELAGKIKYITIAGDSVDGIGIYPGQKEELTIQSITGQYDELARLLERIPDYIEIIKIPGNHDAVRVADPQPCISEEVAGALFKMPNFHMMASPSYCSLHDIEFLMYHGKSIHNMVPHLANLNYEHPEKVIKEYLIRRHVHPVYGERPPITPEKRDYCVIERIPDVVHIGDVHKNGYMTYKGVIGVNSGFLSMIL